MRSSAWLTLILALAVTACHAVPHRLTRMRLRAVADADTAFEADAEVALDASAHAHAHVSAEVAAEAAALVAAADAAEQARADAESSRHRVMFQSGTNVDAATERAQAMSDAARAGAGSGAGAGVYHADHLAACVAMHGWLAGLGGGFGAAAGPAVADHQVVMNWIAAQHPPHGQQNMIQQITGYVRWGQRMGLAHGAVCTQVLLTPLVLAYDRRANGANFLARYTIGLEWELHWLQVLPSNDFADATSFPLWRSGHNTNPAQQRWLTIVNDHSGQQPLLSVGGQSRTIVEVIFGPNYCNSASNLAGSPTDIAIGDSRQIITNLKYVLENGGVNAFGYMGAAALAAALDARTGTMGHRTQHAHADFAFDNTYDRIVGSQVNDISVDGVFGTAGFADPTLYKIVSGDVRYPGPQRQFQFRPMGVKPEKGMAANWAEQWTPAVVAPGAWNNEYIQTNFLMPVSAMCSARFIAVQTQAWQRDAVTAARLAARSYILHYDAAGIAALSDEDRGDLLGAWTGLFYRALYGITTNTALYTRVESGIPTSTPKNWHDYMLKTSFHRPFLFLSPAATQVLNRLYAATDLPGGNNAADRAVDELRQATIAAGSALVQAWGNKMTGGGGVAVGIRAWASAEIKMYLRMAYPVTNLANPNWSRAPSGSNPPAYVATNDVVPSVVIESRFFQNTLNTEVKDGTVATINGELAQLQRRFGWNGGGGGNWCA